MFTGIIATVGQVAELTRRRGGVRLRVTAPAQFLAGVERGDSIAVSGCCLTATELTSEGAGRAAFIADLAAETLRRTRFAQLRAGEAVNLELPLRAGQPLGGHIVQGHVDGVGFVVAAGRRERGRLAVRVPLPLLPFVATQGSLAVEGVSLTVAALAGDRAEFAIIPFTRRHTNLGRLHPGSAVNVEVDLVARYLARLTGAVMATPTAALPPSRPLGLRQLRRQGF
ncbi:MAG: riboflavin synthase [Terriglobales bacterium]